MIDPTTDLRELPVKFISVGASTNIFAGSDVYNSTCDFLMLDVQRPYELLCTSGMLQTKALHGNQYDHLTLHEVWLGLENHCQDGTAFQLVCCAP